MSQQEKDLQQIAALVKARDEAARLRSDAIKRVNEVKWLWRAVAVEAVIILILIGALTGWKMPFVGGY